MIHRQWLSMFIILTSTQYIAGATTRLLTARTAKVVTGHIKYNPEHVAQCMPLSSIQHPNSIKNALHELIDGSRNRLFMAMYTLTDIETVYKIHWAKLRGVNVECIVDKNSDVKISGEKFSSIEALIQTGIKVLVFKASCACLHSKYVGKDHDEFLLTTANATPPGLNKNCEVGVVFQNPHLVEFYYQDFLSLKKAVEAQQTKLLGATQKNTDDLTFKMQRSKEAFAQWKSTQQSE